jgi:hypothetical protein
MDKVTLTQGGRERFKSCGPLVIGSGGLASYAFVTQTVGVALDID